jgi:hypothetical protein
MKLNKIDRFIKLPIFEELDLDNYCPTPTPTPENDIVFNYKVESDGKEVEKRTLQKQWKQ